VVGGHGKLIFLPTSDFSADRGLDGPARPSARRKKRDRRPGRASKNTPQVPCPTSPPFTTRTGLRAERRQGAASAGDGMPIGKNTVHVLPRSGHPLLDGPSGSGTGTRRSISLGQGGTCRVRTWNPAFRRGRTTVERDARSRPPPGPGRGRDRPPRGPGLPRQPMPHRVGFAGVFLPPISRSIDATPETRTTVAADRIALGALPTTPNSAVENPGPGNEWNPRDSLRLPVTGRPEQDSGAGCRLTARRGTCCRFGVPSRTVRGRRRGRGSLIMARAARVGQGGFVRDKRRRSRSKGAGASLLPRATQRARRARDMTRVRCPLANRWVGTDVHVSLQRGGRRSRPCNRDLLKARAALAHAHEPLAGRVGGQSRRDRPTCRTGYQLSFAEADYTNPLPFP